VQRIQLQEAHRTGNSATANELNDFRKKVWEFVVLDVLRFRNILLTSNLINSTSKASGRLEFGRTGDMITPAPISNHHAHRQMWFNPVKTFGWKRNLLFLGLKVTD
jgi:hypothetical protein